MREPDLSLKLALTNEQLFVLGLVTAQWAYLELQLDFCIDHLLRHPKASRKVTSLVLRFAARMKLMHDLVDEIVTHKVDRQKFYSILSRSTRLRRKRDELVHGMWMICDEDPDIAHLHLYRHKADLEIRFGPVSTDQMIRLAEQISKVATDLRALGFHRDPKRRYVVPVPPPRSWRQPPEDRRFGPRQPLASRATPPPRFRGLHRLKDG